MKILVTGGAGFIGSSLSCALAQIDHDVTVFDDLSRGRYSRVEGLRCLQGDIRSRAEVLAAMEGQDVVYHLAYVQGTQNFYEIPSKVVDVALNGITNVMAGLEAEEGKTLILVSSSEVYQVPPKGMVPTAEDVPLSVPDVTNPRYSYGAGKIASEVAALAYSPFCSRTIIARPHNIYGADMGDEHVIPQLAKKMRDLLFREQTAGYEGVGGPSGLPLEFPIMGTGRETRSFCHVSDCVDALMLLLEKGEDCGVYHIGNPEEITITQLVEEMAAHFGLNLEILPGELAKGSPPRRCPDIDKLIRLGFEPTIPLAAGLPPTLAWYANHV